MNSHGKTMTTSQAAHVILDARKRVSPEHSVLVGISGIDGSGKGYVATEIAAMLRERSCRVTIVNVDGWLQLPHKRFDPSRPAQHFYENGIRFDEMFSKLILPLRENCSIELYAKLADATNSMDYIDRTYWFENVDVILLEGIFLFRREQFARGDRRDCRRMKSCATIEPSTSRRRQSISSAMTPVPPQPP
jgi:uridine kinase